MKFKVISTCQKCKREESVEVEGQQYCQKPADWRVLTVFNDKTTTDFLFCPSCYNKIIEFFSKL